MNATEGHYHRLGGLLPACPRFHGRCRHPANRLDELHAPVAQLDRALPSEGKGHTFESCRVRQLFFVLQRDMQTQPATSVLVHSRK
jgi:hypothetical protein